MPPTTGMSFILLQHLDPRHDTLMPELLAKHTPMAVAKAEDGRTLEPNQIYVIPPNALLALEGRALRVSTFDKNRRQTPLIDHFFRSLAASQRDGAVAVILSGTGSDGTLGMKAVKEHGGLTIAQSPDSARYDSMPRSAISAGVVDYVLGVDEMPERIMAYAEHLNKLHSGAGEESGAAEALARIFPILREKTGHDFSRYKQSTVMRRIHRRMRVAYIKSLREYVEWLEGSDEEKQSLFKDLLIGVTQFFRDEEAFAHLERKVMPALFRDKGGDGQIRIWVPGCASGEEAYSIAILACEQASRQTQAPKVQIFATDLDTEALTVARKARYSDEIAAQVSAERLARFFTRHGDSFELREEIREMCVFSPHNLIKDPPFSRLDLISCRNVLIYLEAEAQRKLLQIFHYALNPSGFLFLGPSESVANRGEMFDAVDSKARLFQRKPAALRELASVPLIETRRMTRAPAAGPVQIPIGNEQTIARTIERIVMEDYAPGSAIVNERGEIIYFSGRTEKYLAAPVGSPTNKLLEMAKPAIRMELRTLLHRALNEGREATRENLAVELETGVQPLNLIVRPLPEVGKDSRHFIVVFQEIVPAASSVLRPVANAQTEGANPVVEQLEHELRTIREDLQTTIEELETSNEELKSANEELLSMNEELQSTNEELQTSKEEVQSVNDELQRKVDELDAAHADLHNLFQSTDVAAIFVDKDLRITRFTPAVYGVTRLGEREIGRRLMDVAPELAGTGALEDMEETLRTLAPREREMSVGGGQKWLVRRITPYRALDQTVQGLVITFSDVTEIRRADEQRSRLAAIVEGSEDAIIGHAPDGIVTSWNHAAELIYGYSASEAVGQPISFIIPRELAHEMAAVYTRLLRGESVARFNSQRMSKSGQIFDVSVTVSPIRDDHQRVIGFSSLTRDITQLLRAAEQQARLASIVANSDDAIVSKSLDGIVTSWNDGAERIFGYTAAEMVGQSILKIIPLDRHHEEPAILDRLRQGQRVDHFETVRRRKDGTLIDISVTISPVRDASGRIIGASKIARDISTRKQMEAALREAKESLERQVAERTADLHETVRSLEGVCYSMAHDLRAPVRSIHGFAQILLTDYAHCLDADGKLYTERMIGATARMEQLITDLLRFAKLAHEDLPVANVDVQEHVRKVSEDLAAELQRKRAEIIVAPGPGMMVRANPTVIRQVLQNIIANAITFVEPGVAPRVEISVARVGDRVQICIADNGIGIPKEYQQKIFGLFERLHTPEQYPGTGVGLALVKRGIERTGGHISVDSEPGRGSRFCVDFPAADAIA